MYQIFPDRFYRSGNNIPQKKHAVLHCDWNEPPMYYLDPDTKNVITYDYFGGNIQGIKEKLSYLKDFGATVKQIKIFIASPLSAIVKET